MAHLTPALGGDNTEKLQLASTFAESIQRFHFEDKRTRSSPRRRVTSPASAASTSYTVSCSTPPTKRRTLSDGKESSSTLHSASKSPRKRQKTRATFEDMAEIPDRLAKDLDILFCGYNPGVRSSELGYHYAHPSNRFYRILHESGLTERRLKPEDSPSMPETYKLGLTDLVARCTARADQVSSLEFQAGAVGLLEKIIKWRPKMVCFVGMDVYRNFRKHFAAVLDKDRVRVKSEIDDKVTLVPRSPPPSPHKQSKSDVRLGLQEIVLSIAPEDVDSAPRDLVRLFVIPSSSGLAAGYSDQDRIGYLKLAKEIVMSIRAGWYAEPSDILAIDAELHLESRIQQQAAGKWSFVKSEADL